MQTQHKKDSGVDALMFVIFKMSFPVWSQYNGVVPPEELEKLDKHGDLPHGVAAAAIERLNRDQPSGNRLNMNFSDDETWTYEQYRERLDSWLRKHAQRKAVKARRTERNRVRQLGGGKAVASLVLKPITRKRK